MYSGESKRFCLGLEQLEPCFLKLLLQSGMLLVLNLSMSQQEDYSTDLEPQSQAGIPCLYTRVFCGL